MATGVAAGAEAVGDYRRRRGLATLCMLLLMGAGSVPVTHVCNMSDPRRASARPEDILYLPRGKTLKYMTLGYNGAAADMTWIRGVLYVGRKLSRHETNYKWMEKLYQVTTDLDPHWTRPYHVGAILLSALPQEDDRAMELLRKGMANNGWNPDTPFQAAQLKLFRGRTRESVKYLKLIDRCMRPPKSDEARLAQGWPPLTPEQHGILKQAALVIPQLLREGGDYRQAVTIAVNNLSRTDDRVMRRVMGNGYRETMARLLEHELTGAAVHFRNVRGRPPATVKELLELPEVRLRDGRRLPAVRDHFLKRMTNTCLGNATLAAQILERLPGDSLGMQMYIRDGTAHSRGLERVELQRRLKSLNFYLQGFKKASGRPAANLEELIRYVQLLARKDKLPAGARAFFRGDRGPIRLPEHPEGPDGWQKMSLNAAGQLEMPPGPNVQDLFAADYPLPPAPRERERPASGGAKR